ncbi:MAG: anaerobic ribonucleoside-triphosphate reductase activating protein [Eubacteriales bacterium]|nr:anaerobic ribonucleoside-triphosphate reductase activating protein [Eubacteriales bacterium]MDD4583192.1 anaerobic ribonucleoside-triphosphate reductase activating protein [Eubacteriales bacterium]
MNISGIIKSSFIDYPGKICTVIFLAGCNFRCGYCHNPELVKDNHISPVININEFINFLNKRKKFLDAVCISGGEPTIYPDLPHLIKKIKDMGFEIKLDTNGTNPEVLKNLIGEGLLDYVAMDIKGPLDRYGAIVRHSVDLATVRESAGLLIQKTKESRLNCEFRTTVCRELLTESDLKRMIDEFPCPPKWFLQAFKNPGEILDQGGIYSAYSKNEMKEMGRRLCVNVR